MKEVSFGQYYPVKSFVHNMNPALKILFLIAYIVAIFLAKNFYGLAACAFVLVLIIIFSRVPLLKVLRAIKGVAFLVIFTAVINVLFHGGDELYWTWFGEETGVYVSYGIIQITQAGIVFSLFLIIRLVLLVTCSSLLTDPTTPVALTDGIEVLLTPLKWIRFPVHALALIMSIALRFIPILMDETERIKNAQKARGADLEKGGLVKKVRSFVPILVPLLLSAFRRADELGDAMDARCYTGGKKRTKYKKLRLSWRDLIGFLTAAALIAGVVLLRIYLRSPL